VPEVALRDRLARLGATSRPVQKPPDELPRGFELLPTPYGDATVREDVLPLPHLDPHPGRIAYLDTETTGLAGGTGTYVFCAAVASPVECGLRLAQFFLPQPAAEPAFLHALSEEVRAANAVATFNGASFDLPILRTRWVMARMPGEADFSPHVDLLTLVRALYRHRLESCNLRVVEERVLGYEREDPLPSAQVPDAYFDYLRRGPSTLLEAALEHNRLDVISLVHLHSRLLLRLRGQETGMDAADWLALGKHRFRRGARADGWRALRNASSFGAGEAAATAGLTIARRLVRRGSIAAADRLLAWVEANSETDIRVAVARARLLEWRRRDPEQALGVVEAAQGRMPELALELEHRRARLARKLSRRRLARRRERQIRQLPLEASVHLPETSFGRRRGDA
jgi:uncharacterized protein